MKLGQVMSRMLRLDQVKSNKVQVVSAVFRQIKSTFGLIRPIEKLTNGAHDKKPLTVFLLGGGHQVEQKVERGVDCDEKVVDADQLLHPLKKKTGQVLRQEDLGSKDCVSCVRLKLDENFSSLI